MRAEAFLLVTAFMFAILDWISLLSGWKVVDYIAKPGVILGLLLSFVLVSPQPRYERTIIWTEIGLLCALIGDILLMLPRERFQAGLVSFLLAYLAYTIAFTPGLPPLTLGWILLLVVSGSLTIFLLRSIIASLDTARLKRFKIPVLIFGMTLFFMATAALGTNLRPDWPTRSALAIGLGGALVYLSDSLLSWNRFVRPFSSARVKIRIPYHLGQISIAMGVFLLSIQQA